MITVTTDRMPRDLNKFAADYLKTNGMSVADSELQILVKSEPGRTWIKYAGKTSVTAHG